MRIFSFILLLLGAAATGFYLLGEPAVMPGPQASMTKPTDVFTVVGNVSVSMGTGTDIANEDTRPNATQP